LLHRRKPGTEGAVSTAAPSPSTGNTTSGTPPIASDGADWGALPPEAVGIERVKPLRPLIASAPQGPAKKA
jgi:magnesium chelatase subunit I